MRIAIASDHAGYQYKEALRDFLTADGHDVHDFGTDSEESVDYPQFIRPAVQAVTAGLCERAIVLGGSGNGEAMVANRHRGIRCALCWNEDSARLARAHNDSNVLSMGERLLSFESVRAIVQTWLTTPFDGDRHLRRIRQIDDAIDGEV